ncbi:GNAT family N-acetyltransferase [Paenibacillus sp. sgz500992]|uniref:GNAT family N-acetyltransferase n=1 Tax=Paenibacillus sp. sgz500992 TaxID=3242476 RepID=UPI0036D2290C
MNFEFPVLETDRLRLREITAEDAEGIFACFSSSEVMRYYGQEPLTTLAQAGEYVDFFADSFRDKRGIRWGIELKGSKGLIGTIGFNAWSPKHQRAEIGYELNPDFWRKGYAAEAVSRVLAYGFERMELTRIGAVVFTGNEVSKALLVKQGFQQEGLLRNYMVQDGKPHDTNVYSIVK